MAEQKVELRKIRDFSEVLNDTFLFIKQNIKPLLASFVAIAGIFMLASAIFTGLYRDSFGSVLQSIIYGTLGSNDSIDSSMSFTYILLPILGWLDVVAMKTSVIAYMKVYEAKGGEAPELMEVWEVFKQYFLKIFFYSIPIVFVIAIGACFCFLPGVYLWVVFLPFEMILVMEDQTFTGAWDRCYTIIRENWWPSFGIYIVAYLINITGTWIVGGIMTVITGIFTYFTTKDFSSTFTIVTSILNVLSFVFFIIFYIAAILNYFSLVEKYDGIGMMKRLEGIGGNTASHSIEEEY